MAPAGPVDPTIYRDGLRILSARYRLVHAFEPPFSPGDELPYLAGGDAARCAALQQALEDERVDAVFCARGGYGAMRLLQRLDPRALSARRVPLVGFSDVTALHAWASRAGIPSVHGPVVTQLPRLPEVEVLHLFELLEGKRLPELRGLTPLRPGRARGPLRGGNLTLLSHLLGTPYFPDLTGAILLLEDVGEAPYRLDRMLTQLRLAGALSGVAGILLGEFTDCDERAGGSSPLLSAARVLEERLGELEVPVLAGAPVGHGRHNEALPLEYVAELDAEHGTLRVLGPP